MPNALRAIALCLGLAFVGAIVGTAVGVGAAFLINTWPSGWRTLAAPPQPAAQIVAADADAVFIEDADGHMYRCGLARNATCWESWPGEIQPGIDVDNPPDQPCTAEFQPQPPGGGSVDFYYAACYPELVEAAAYRLRADGGVEVWTTSSSSWLALAAFSTVPFLGCGVGALLGLMIGLILFLGPRRRTRMTDTTTGMNVP